MKKTLISSSSGKLLAVGGIPRYISSDAAAINAVKQVKSFTISKNAADQLEVTFTPIINEKLFAEIEDGHTQIRLQLLTHKRCGDTYVDGTVLLPKNNFKDQYNGDQKDYKNMARRKPFSPTTYGATWIKLSPQELRNGRAILSPTEQNFLANNQESRTGSGVYVAVEMYVPALGQFTRGTFEYVWSKDAHKISNVIKFSY